MHRALSSLSFVAVDTETTGSSTRKFGDRIIEIAAVRFTLGEVTAVWQQTIWPHRPIQPGAQAVHGISSDDLQGAPCFHEIVDEFLDFVGDAVAVMHNAPFDCNFLAVHLAESNRRWQPQVLDTLRLLRRNFQLPANNLGTALRHFGIALPASHRAADDAVATAHLFQRIVAQLGPPATLGDCLPFHGPLASIPVVCPPAPAPTLRAAHPGLVLVDYAERSQPLVGLIEGTACGEVAGYCTLRLTNGRRLHLRQERIRAIRPWTMRR